MRHAKKYQRGAKVKAVLFFGALAALLVFSLILPLRPEKSLQEGRELTKFPEFPSDTLSSEKFLGGVGDCFLEMGAYFDGIDLWFSDTFPGRDAFMKINKNIRSCYGIHTVEIHGEVQQGDEIPDTIFTGD